MERNQAGFVEFGPADCKKSLVQIYILPLQLDRLTDAESPYDQKTK